MKRKIFIVLLSALGAFVVFAAASVAWFIYNNEYRLTEAGREVSPDGQYAVVFEMVGTPEWPFGFTTVKVTVKNTAERAVVKIINTTIQDDGAVLREGNWTVVWQEDSALITLKGSEQADALYEVPLDKAK